MTATNPCWSAKSASRSSVRDFGLRDSAGLSAPAKFGCERTQTMIGRTGEREIESPKYVLRAKHGRQQTPNTFASINTSIISLTNSSTLNALLSALKRSLKTSSVLRKSTLKLLQAKKPATTVRDADSQESATPPAVTRSPNSKRHVTSTATSALHVFGAIYRLPQTILFRLQKVARTVLETFSRFANPVIAKRALRPGITAAFSTAIS